jgi:CRISPR-associated protein Csd2
VGTDTNAEQRKQQAKLGCAPAHKLFALVTDRIRKGEGIQVPRSISDYILPKLDEVKAGLPAGVELHYMSDLAKQTKASVA